MDTSRKKIIVSVLHLILIVAILTTHLGSFVSTNVVELSLLLIGGISMLKIRNGESFSQNLPYYLWNIALGVIGMVKTLHQKQTLSYTELFAAACIWLIMVIITVCTIEILFQSLEKRYGKIKAEFLAILPFVYLTFSFLFFGFSPSTYQFEPFYGIPVSLMLNLWSGVQMYLGYFVLILSFVFLLWKYRSSGLAA